MCFSNTSSSRVDFEASKSLDRIVLVNWHTMQSVAKPITSYDFGLGEEKLKMRSNPTNTLLDENDQSLSVSTLHGTVMSCHVVLRHVNVANSGQVNLFLITTFMRVNSLYFYQRS